MSRVELPTRSALTSKARARKRRRRNVAIGAIVTVALVAGGGGVAFAATRSSGTDYRTVTASSGTVTETVNLTGTVASARTKDAAFETAGTVRSVAVTVGDTVTAGETLATLDRASLTAAITSAQQSVTQADQQRDSDLSAESSTSSSSSSGSAEKKSGGSAGSGSGSTESAAVVTAVAAVTAAQTALIAAYKTEAADVEATDALVTASTPTCAPFVAATISDTDATESDGSTETPAQQLTAAQAALAGCKTAISGVLSSEQATDAAEDQVKSLATDLDTAVAALQAALGGSSTTTKTSSATLGSAATVTLAADVTTSGGSGSTGGSTTITAATILSDEAAITAAKAQLAIAKNDRTLGTLSSPISGTVAAVDITTGSSVSAGSTTDVITIIGDDGYVISSTTTLTGVEELRVGDAVAITVPSTSKTLAGTISSIGILNVSTSTTPSYDVTVAVTDKEVSILNGASAAMVVTADVAKDVLTVPTSAVHRASRTYTLEVLKDGKEVATTVKVGATGTELTQITSGIGTGTVVVLADVSSTTVGTSTTTTTSTSGGLSGLSGSTTGTTGTGGPPSGGFGASS